jgi:hypothetical protein
LTLGEETPSIVDMAVTLRARAASRALFMALAFLAPTLFASARELDVVVSGAIEALGGADRLRSCQTRLTVGKISFDGGGANPFTVEQKRPRRLHMEIFFPTGVLVRAFDGETGWLANPFAENREPQPMSAEETRNIAEEAEFDDPLLDWRARGSRVELLGSELVEDRKADRLRVTTKNGLVQELLLDALTHLRLGWEGARQANGKETLFLSSFKDYRTVGGLWFPFRISSRAIGNENRQEIVLTRVELDTPIDDARFAFPKPAVKPAGSPKP